MSKDVKRPVTSAQEASAIKPLREAADPFMRVSRMLAALPIPDDRPLREVLPGLWPTWGEFQGLMAAITVAIDAALS